MARSSEAQNSRSMTVRPATEGLVFSLEPLQLHLQAADLLIVLGPASNRRGSVLSLILPFFRVTGVSGPGNLPRGTGTQYPPAWLQIRGPLPRKARGNLTLGRNWRCPQSPMFVRKKRMDTVRRPLSLAANGICGCQVNEFAVSAPIVSLKEAALTAGHQVRERPVSGPRSRDGPWFGAGP